jgi:predicted DNA-binding transcriptional regulator AlpA
MTLADVQMLTLREVESILKIGRSTFWRIRNSRGFPPAIRVGRSKRWRLADIHKWQENGGRPLSR